MDKNLNRNITPYVLSTWTTFRNPFPVTTQIEDTVKAIGEKHEQFPNLIEKLCQNAKRTHFKSFIDRHVTKNETGEINKKSLGNLFRAVGSKILPIELLGCKKNVEMFLKNINLLFLAGKSTEICGAELIKNIDRKFIDWALDDIKFLAVIALWMAQSIFWRLLRKFFHITGL